MKIIKCDYEFDEKGESAKSYHLIGIIKKLWNSFEVFPNQIFTLILIFEGFGGVFAPCLRNDVTLNIAQPEKENFSLLLPPLGCCEVMTRNTAGTTTAHMCADLTGGIYLYHS